jgi:localization factor PodJL
MEQAVEANVRAYRQDAESDQAPPRVPYTTASFDLDAAFSRSRDAEAESFGEPQLPKRSMEVLRHDFIADAHRAKLKAASRPEAAGGDSDLRAGQLSAGTREASAKPRRRSIFSFRSQRVAMSLLVLLAAIPAAIFFMPRTPAPKLDAIPAAATIAPAAKPADALPQSEPTMDESPMMPAPEAAPPAVMPRSKQTKQVVPPLEKGEYEDVNATDAPVDTASLQGITMQNNDATGQQLAQANEQQRMAYLSSQLGTAAAKVSPAALMEEHVLRRNGGAATNADEELAPESGASKLPPATVGPFSLRLAATQGDASAQFEVASRLAEGKGTDQDLKEAALWYHRAAASGFAMAQFRLGTLYERGLGVKPDAQRAQVWYERAAAQGNVKAMHNLAVLAASRSPKGDYEGAARWFKAAAEFGLADSQFNLAVLHENGLGVAKDVRQAYTWLLLAAKSGDKDASARLDTLKPKLSADELAAAETAAKEWQAKPMQRLANDARVAGQVWKDGNRRG